MTGPAVPVKSQRIAVWLETIARGRDLPKGRARSGLARHAQGQVRISSLGPDGNQLVLNIIDKGAWYASACAAPPSRSRT